MYQWLCIVFNLQVFPQEGNYWVFDWFVVAQFVESFVQSRNDELHLGHVQPDEAVSMSSSPLLELYPVAVEEDFHGVVFAHHDVLDERLETLVEDSGHRQDVVLD